MKKEIKKFIYESFETLVGSVTMAIAVSFFLLPCELSSGGFSGIATITYYLFNFPMGITILILNIPLFILATFKIGKSFLCKSIIGTISLSFFIDFFNQFKPLTNDKFLACIYGGILTGLGTAIILKANSSTGGSDLLSIILKEYNSMFRTGTLIIIIDTIIVFFNVIFLKRIEIGLYSAITIYLMGKIIDIIFEGIYFTKLIFIISDKNNEISKFINQTIHRGVSGLYGKGIYSNSDRMILMCAVGRNDLVQLKKGIKVIDPRAFLIITNSREVIGSRFQKISSTVVTFFCRSIL